MERASESLDFEKAVILRDRIKSLNIIQSSQRINDANLIEADVIAGYKESGKACIQVFFYRSKQNWGNQAFYPKHDTDDNVKEIISSFLTQFYENKVVPSMIITNTEVKDLKLLEKAFSLKEKRDVLIKKAKSKDEVNISKLAEKNAKQALTIANRGYVLVNGENLRDGSGKELLLNKDVRKSFLGG